MCFIIRVADDVVRQNKNCIMRRVQVNAKNFTYNLLIEWGRSFGTWRKLAALHTNSWKLASQWQTSLYTGHVAPSVSCGNWAPTQCCNCSADITTAAAVVVNNSRRMLLCRARVSVHFSLNTCSTTFVRRTRSHTDDDET